MKAYIWNEDKIYRGAIEINESPKEPGIFLLPPNATPIKPPIPKDGKQPKWDGEEWALTKAVPLTADEIGLRGAIKITSETDMNLASVLEDLLNLLIDKEVIQLSDLSETSQSYLQSLIDARRVVAENQITEI